MGITIFNNARIFTSSPQSEDLFSGCLMIDNETITYVGHSDGEEIARARAGGASEVDMENKVITPSFIDAHIHIMHLGQALGKLNILSFKSFPEISHQIRTWAASNPSAPRILCRGWLQASTGGKALAAMLDELDERPIYVEAMDLHSVWCNSAALEELGVESMPDPPGGTIHRDSQGNPSGLLEEMAHLGIVVPFLTRVLSPEQAHMALHRAFLALSRAGYTGFIDMAMDDEQWSTILEYQRRKTLPIHVAAHWLIPYDEDIEHVQAHMERAIEMHAKYNPSTSPSLCVVGIKLIADGTVDGCTAALSKPYGAKDDPIEPIWPAAQLAAVVRQADEAGLQVAIHAIGDRAVSEALDAFEQLRRSPHSRRHRIEHLELTSDSDAMRLGNLGITASVQPVHSDPVLFRAWPSLIGTHRCKRAFAYRDFHQHGSPLAFGTDAPTAAHYPLPNLYNATTRRSALEPASRERTNADFAVSLATALKAATSGAAYSRHAETWTGSLQKGLSADFVVLETDWTADGLLAATVHQTWFRGRLVFDLPSS
ncbi:hypothetical protein B0A52_08934 [Exophiala mesophila]|uniref:Amidohydrolase 3 domain-containing protein n=1 Tax=Exophiala mesophila TaxID=212818 RepID=A0A438MSY2_EXOME|nr:hypothetical protein B0A52_08934 [Exophiala mesophila]